MDPAFYESLMEPISMIEDNLFLGNRSAALSIEILRFCEISSIVQIQSFDTAAFHPGEFRYHLVTLTDLEESDLMQVLPTALRFIDSELKAGGKVLVHCDAGVSRSGSVMIAYIMYSKGKNFTEALQFVQSKRLCVGPNEGFVQQLRALTPETLAEMLAIRA